MFDAGRYSLDEDYVGFFVVCYFHGTCSMMFHFHMMKRDL